ncbi:HNH endonuclease [Mesorhizobium sp. M0915]|uniref:HNH endonuclease n=1 Tax=unclassified Mesorhizobium TaxID=325217 RepID=UPI00333DF4A4
MAKNATLKLRTLAQRLRPSLRVKVSVPDKKAEPFYLTPAWRALVDDLMQHRFGGRDKAQCEDRECRQPHRRGIRLFGDHIVERKDGGTELDPANVMFRCGSCHTRKTAVERSRRQRG